ncbi:MAG: hypothetical protein K8R28_05445, partial [Desulfobacterales bacterium]|nr:hypothetical protein [Desulfobacterales bacterium]
YKIIELRIGFCTARKIQDIVSVRYTFPYRSVEAWKCGERWQTPDTSKWIFFTSPKNTIGSVRFEQSRFLDFIYIIK